MDEQNPVIPEIKLNDQPVVPVSNTVNTENRVNTDGGVAPVSQQKKRLNFRGSIKISKKALKIFGVIVIILVIFGLAIGIPGTIIYGKAKVLNSDYEIIKGGLAKQNINDIKTGIAKFKTDLGSFGSSYNLLAWTRFIPVLGNYWKDGSAAIKGGQYAIDAAQLGIAAAEPYADIIGFTGDTSKKAKNAEENANNRVEFIVSTIKDVIPKVDAISQKALLAKEQFDQIDPNRYPGSLFGKPVRDQLRKALELVDQGTELISQSKPLLESAPYLMGIDSPRTYLVLFQNDKELRPTGGFITGYSVMTIDKGKVSPVSSNDIYNLDKAYSPSIKAPDPIIKYIKGPYTISTGLRLRDMNFNPDFKLSMETFLAQAQKAGIGKVDGVIAVDTQVLVKLLNVLGNVGVPGYGNFNTEIVAECNCPKVIFELESFADVEGAVVWDQNDPTKIIFAPANYYNRKEIVGPLMNSVLRNAMGQPKEKLPGLFQAAWESLTEKHVLFYMLDSQAQAGIESFNIGGRVRDYEGDYLLVADANLGGRKSNLYVTNEVEQDINISGDGSVTKTLTLTYKNSQGYDGWLNSVLPSWVRIYVPKGSQLVSITGLDDKVDPYEDLGKTVFAGLYNLRPQGVAKIVVKYKLPFKVKGEYKELVQKQPGIDTIMYTIIHGRQTENTILKADQEFRFKI